MPRVFNTASYWSIGRFQTRGAMAGTQLQTWRASNRALFVPVALPKGVVRALAVFNGNVVSGNIDLGLYTQAGTRIVSKGSTAQAGGSAIQTLDVTDTQVEAGTYLMACALDNTTGRVQVLQPPFGAEITRSFGCKEAASAFALPASATLSSVSVSDIPSMSVVMDQIDLYEATPKHLPVLAVNPALDCGAMWSITSNVGQFFAINAAGAWTSANRAYYYPFHLEHPETFTQAFWINGATVGNNHVDVGVYTAAGKRLYSTGSTTTAGASAAQKVTGLTWTLPAGDFYLAMAVDGTTDTFQRATGTDLNEVGAFMEASAFPLPATMTGATVTSHAEWAFGLLIPSLW